MAGQIIKRGDRTWLVRVFLGRDQKTGKRRYVNKTINGTQKDAQKHLNAKLREIDLGGFIEPAAMTVDEYLNQWLETAAKPRVRERTYTWYMDLLRLHVRPVIGNKKLSDVRPLDVQSIYTKMQGRELSAKTVRYAHVVLSSAFKQAVKWRMLSHNPADVVELPRITRKEMKYLSPGEAVKFLEVAAEDRWAVIFNLALTTGMRPEEYLALQWKDVDLEREQVTIRRALIW